MGTLDKDLVRANVNALFRQLGIARWNAPLSLTDIALLIGKKLRVSGAVAHAAVADGFLVPIGGGFSLTAAGWDEVSRYTEPTSVAVVFGSHTTARVAPAMPLRVRQQQSARALRRLMESFHASEEEILRQYATGPGATAYFDMDFLKQNTTYQRLMAAGEV